MYIQLFVVYLQLYIRTMEINKEGYSYRLRNYDDKSEYQEVNFIRKVRSDDSNVYTLLTEDGTTTEEVVSMLIHRLKYLDTVKKSSFNKLAIKHLNEVLSALSMRKQTKIETYVENKEGSGFPLS